MPAAAPAVGVPMTADDDLIARCLNGLASDEERAELDRRVAASPGTADAFVRASRLDRALDRHFHEEGAISRVQVRIRRHRLRRRLTWAAAAAVALVAVVLFRASGDRREPLAFRDA